MLPSSYSPALHFCEQVFVWIWRGGCLICFWLGKPSCFTPSWILSGGSFFWCLTLLLQRFNCHRKFYSKFRHVASTSRSTQLNTRYLSRGLLKSKSVPSIWHLLYILTLHWVCLDSRARLDHPYFSTQTIIMQIPSTLDPNGSLDRTYVVINALWLQLKFTTSSKYRIGILYLGVVLSAILYGLCLLQTSLYFRSRASTFTSCGTSFLTKVKSTSRIHDSSKPPWVFWMIVIRLHDYSHCDNW